jgi:hypothetical protein
MREKRKVTGMGQPPLFEIVLPVTGHCVQRVPRFARPFGTAIGVGVKEALHHPIQTLGEIFESFPKAQSRPPPLATELIRHLSLTQWVLSGPDLNE